MTNLKELLEYEIQDMFSAETQLSESLTKLSLLATNAKLKTAIDSYSEQTKVHIERLRMVASLLDCNPIDQKCKAMKAIIKQGMKLAEAQIDLQVRDALIIGIIQRMAHYKTASYGTSHHYAKTLSFGEETRVLNLSLEEEKAADQQFNNLAIKEVNILAIN
jgi:ferritin-like metal-binding protein YciE